MRLFGTSGIRGIVDRDLIALAFKVGMAVGKTYANVIVGNDTRTSKDAMKHALISGLLASGASCSDAGIIPTPTLAFIAREFDAGVMITASHNPSEYNGIKLWNPDGSAFDSIQQEQIEGEIVNEAYDMARWSEIKSSSLYSAAIARHIERIMTDFPDGLKLKVMVDADCGAASIITPELLTKLGCEVVTLNCYYSGFFPRAIEPLESNLEELIKLVKESGADLGIAHDGDADRMMAVDDKGRFIPGDKLLAILARTLEAKDMVTTIDTSMAIDEIGLNVRRTRVGDAAVSEELRNGGDFGGEPSGSWIFPTISLCPDGIYAAAQIAAIASQEKLSELVDSVPGYPLLRGSLPVDNTEIPALESGLLTMKPLSVNNVDGIKLNFADGWLLVRASGTEPKIRLTAEAKSEARVHELYDDGIRIIMDCIKNKEKVG
ncbi:phosphoglucosamine mutase [Chloroflexota bacterium]